MNNKTVNDRVAQRLKTMRLILGLSQSKLAEQLEFSAQQLQNYESGKSRINFDTLERISAALGSSAEEVLGKMEDIVPNFNTLMLGLDFGPHHGDTKTDLLYEIVSLLSGPDSQTMKANILELLKAIEIQRPSNSST